MGHDIVPCDSRSSNHTFDSQSISEANLTCDITPSVISSQPNSYHSIDNQNTSENLLAYDLITGVTSINQISCNSIDSQSTSEAQLSYEEEISSRGREVDNNGKVDKQRLNQLNSEFAELNEPSWKDFTNSKTTPEQFATDFNAMLSSFLLSKPEFKRKVNNYFKHKESKNDSPLEKAKDMKKTLAKKAKSPGATNIDRVQAAQALQHYDYMLKIKLETDEENKKREEDKAYNRNFWKTAKDVTNGTFGKTAIAHTYNKCTADKHYKGTYERHEVVDKDNLKWFPDIEPPKVPYNMCAFKPSDIRKALGKKDKTSAPGYDDILYEFLIKMPYVHKVLATMFTKIRSDGIAPDVWGSSKVKLIHKDGSTDNPTNFRMIALTSNIAKLYHTIEAQRTLDYMVANSYLDPTAQKAYLDGVNGCVEHITVVQEVIEHAISNKKTAHMTWFDLEDAFGSLSHDLIPHVFEHYRFPKEIITYITSLYTKLEGTVETHEWTSDTFKFNRGAFQGDPFSGAIFLVTFNPIINYIKKQEANQGYEIKLKSKIAKNVITTPFADDFNIISKNMKMHQKLVIDVERKLKSMGLVLKPQKCRALSIQSGSPKIVDFHLTNNTGAKTTISSVLDKPLKFLGSIVAEDNTPSARYALLEKKLREKLENIHKSLLRGEHKVAIYSRYALPSMRYFISVHHIHKTHQEQLDTLARKYLKSWLSIPSRGATDASLFHPHMLGIQTPSMLYRDATTSNYTSMRLKGDEVVNHILNSRIERESNWKKKSSTTLEADKIFLNNINKNKFIIPQKEASREEKDFNLNKAKKATKASLKEETLTSWNDKIEKLVMQGDFVKLLAEEKENVTWKSIAFNIPKGILPFALKASTNTLNTPDNLRRWGKRRLANCSICGNHGTLLHILNFCRNISGPREIYLAA